MVRGKGEPTQQHQAERYRKRELFVESIFWGFMNVKILQSTNYISWTEH